jgi:uncharacterized protein (TIGR03118 family)
VKRLRNPDRLSARPDFRFRPRLEALEDRSLPSAGFLQFNLVSDVPGLAALVSPDLVNPWGISTSPNGEFWISEAGTGTTALFNGAGTPHGLVVQVPSPLGEGSPTGTVFNSTGQGFEISAGGVMASSIFLFATADGTIAGWNPAVAPYQTITAIARPGSDFTGMSFSTGADGTYLYATDFAKGTVDVFNDQFQQVALPGAFRDASIPAGFSPFNVAVIDGEVFVTYARPGGRGAGARGLDPQSSGGFVDVFDLKGQLQERLTGGNVNAPWGIAMAPSNFGMFGNDILVGGFGDGHISAFDPATGRFVGTLNDAQGRPIAVPGLWALIFGNGASAGDTDTLYFTAGIDGQRHGLFGAIVTPGAESPRLDASEYDAGQKSDYPLPPPNVPQTQGSLIEAAQIVSAVVPLSTPGVKLVSVPLTVSSVANDTLVTASSAEGAQEAAGVGGSRGANAASDRVGGSDAVVSRELAPAGLFSRSDATLPAAPQEREIPLEQSLGSSLVLDYFSVPQSPGQRARALTPEAPQQLVALAEVPPGADVAPPAAEIVHPVAEVVRHGQSSDASLRAQSGRGWIRRIVEPLVFFVLGTGAGVAHVRDMSGDRSRRRVRRLGQ